MKPKEWKYRIKKQCIEAGVYEPNCDRVIEHLADLLYTIQDFSAEYEKAKEKEDFDTMNACAIRKSDLHKTCKQFWIELMLTPKEYRAFLESNGESKRENKLLALIREDNNVQSE